MRAPAPTAASSWAADFLRWATSRTSSSTWCRSCSAADCRRPDTPDRPCAKTSTANAHPYRQRIRNSMASLRLTFACGPFDRTQALRDGSIKPEGIDLTYLAMQPAEIFWRMLQYNEFDMSEMSLSNYAILVSRGDAPYVAIPAFPSRVFRHGYFFINTT